MTQYIISSIGGSPDHRNRDEEFTASNTFNKTALLQLLQETTTKAKEVLQTVNEAELLRTRQVQGFNFSGIGAALHAVEHFSYHTGQIAFWVKLLKNKDLQFYAGVNLNIKNE